MENTQIIEVPKKLYSTLPQKTIDRVIHVAMDAFGEGMTEKEVLDHVLPTDFLYLAYESDELVGFATSEMKNPIELYLSGAAVLSTAQGKGHYRALTEQRLRAHNKKVKTPVFSLRTQNPKVERTLRSCMENTNPFYKPEGYTLNRTLLPGFYGRMLTREKPVCGIKEIDETYSCLDYEAGDTFLIHTGYRGVISEAFCNLYL